MREILFRGKRVDNGEWVEGYLIQKDGETFIACYPYFTGKVHETSWLEFCFGGFIEVIPETVGQYTGLTDKNGKKIFIDDIVEAKRPPLFQRGVVTQLSDGLYVFKGKKYHDIIDFKLEDVNLERCLSVIGNIHDNPELLEVGE